MSKDQYNKISKTEFIKLNEDDLMFITNPGRMGDEDGLTFIIKEGNELTIYRIDGLMYQKDPEISLDDALKQFPKWKKTWSNSNDKNYKGKYRFIYMGFGNGLSIDNSIYNDYEPYLNYLVDKFLEDKIDKKSLKYAAIYSLWEEAVKDMAKDKQYILNYSRRK